jgi:hypothetical protein
VEGQVASEPSVRAENELDARPPSGLPSPASVQIAWAASLVIAFASVIVALVLTRDDADWIKWLLGATLVAVVVAAFLLAFKVEKRRRFIYSCRSEALDLAFAVSAGLADVVADLGSAGDTSELRPRTTTGTPLSRRFENLSRG